MNTKYLLEEALIKAELRLKEAEEEKRVFFQILQDRSCSSQDFIFYERKNLYIEAQIKHIKETIEKIKKLLSACL